MDPSIESVEQKGHDWAENRKSVIDRIEQIADELDGWKGAEDVANVAGSSVGIVGGGMLLGGLLFPPLAIPGIIMSLAGAGGRIGVGVARVSKVKDLAAEAQRLCEKDADLLNVFLNEAEALLALRASVGVATAAMNGLKASTHLLRNTFITVANSAGRSTLKALLPAAAVGPIRIAAGVTAGLGMALDVVSLIGGISSLASNESDELAVKLRDIANTLQQELDQAIAAQEKNDNDE